MFKVVSIATLMIRMLLLIHSIAACSNSLMGEIADKLRISCDQWYALTTSGLSPFRCLCHFVLLCCSSQSRRKIFFSEWKLLWSLPGRALCSISKRWVYIMLQRIQHEWQKNRRQRMLTMVSTLYFSLSPSFTRARVATLTIRPGCACTARKATSLLKVLWIAQHGKHHIFFLCASRGSVHYSLYFCMYSLPGKSSNIASTYCYSCGVGKFSTEEASTSCKYW